MYCLHSLGFFQLLLVKLLGCQVHLLAAEVLNPEAHTAQLDSIKLFNLVVKLSIGVLQRSDDEPEPVDGFFVQRGIPVIYIESACTKRATSDQGKRQNNLRESCLI